MVPRIVLVRHGRSAHAAGGWLDAEGVRRWFDAYDAAGIADGDEPPAALREAARRAGVLVASDMARARTSVERLAPGADVRFSPLLREIPLAVPALGPLRLPLAGWALATGARWAYRTVRRLPPPPEAARQAREAAAWLAGLAGEHGVVLAVTHASVRSHVAATLAGEGWRCRVAGRRYAHWSSWTLERGAGSAGG